MNRNVRIAKQLVRIAKMLTAASGFKLYATGWKHLIQARKGAVVKVIMEHEYDDTTDKMTMQDINDDVKNIKKFFIKKYSISMKSNFNVKLYLFNGGYGVRVESEEKNNGGSGYPGSGSGRGGYPGSGSGLGGYPGSGSGRVPSRGISEDDFPRDDMEDDFPQNDPRDIDNDLSDAGSEGGIANV